MADLDREIGNDLAAQGRMRDFRVKLDSKIGFGGVGDCREGCRHGLSNGDKVFGEVEELIAMGHPDLEFLWEGGEEGVDVRSGGVFDFVEHCVAVFVGICFDCFGPMDPRQFLL